MINVDLLKKLAFIADITQSFGKLDFSYYKISVNPLLEDSDQIEYAFKVLEVPYLAIKHKHKGAISPNELSVSFGHKVDLKIIYLITYILKEIYQDKLNIYINYFSLPIGSETEILCGSYLECEKSYTNVSRPIKPSEIIRIDILNSTWLEFKELFPNENFDSDDDFYEIDDSYYSESEAKIDKSLFWDYPPLIE